jgi:hypothetical protein
MKKVKEKASALSEQDKSKTEKKKHAHAHRGMQLAVLDNQPPPSAHPISIHLMHLLHRLTASLHRSTGLVLGGPRRDFDS